MDWRNVGERAGWTAAEVLLAGVIAIISGITESEHVAVDAQAVVLVVLAAIGAGLSVVKEAVKARLARR